MTVLIPSYEPANRLLDLIKELRIKTDYNILIVDDGSGGNYRDIFKSAEDSGCIVLTHEINQGKGAALKTGFAYLRENNLGENIVCADSDGQHCVEDIIKIAAEINGEKDEMVLGVRSFDNKTPFKSRFGNRISAFLFTAASGTALSDTQTGLRGYPFSMLDWLISKKGNRFEYELNLLLEAGSSGIAIKQIGIQTIYENQNKGTHFRPFLDSARVLAPVFKFFAKYGASSFTAFIIDFFLLFLIEYWTGSRFFGVVLARIISSAYNYSVNRIIVFKASRIPKKQSAPKYFSFVAVIMFLNYFLLSFLCDIVKMPETGAKILTEMIFFIISYTVQRLFVFKKRKA